VQIVLYTGTDSADVVLGYDVGINNSATTSLEDDSPRYVRHEKVHSTFKRSSDLVLVAEERLNGLLVPQRLAPTECSEYVGSSERISGNTSTIRLKNTTIKIMNNVNLQNF